MSSEGGWIQRDKAGLTFQGLVCTELEVPELEGKHVFRETVSRLILLMHQSSG